MVTIPKWLVKIRMFSPHEMYQSSRIWDAHGDDLRIDFVRWRCVPILNILYSPAISFVLVGVILYSSSLGLLRCRSQSQSKSVFLDLPYNLVALSERNGVRHVLRWGTAQIWVVYHHCAYKITIWVHTHLFLHRIAGKWGSTTGHFIDCTYLPTHTHTHTVGGK